MLRQRLAYLLILLVAIVFYLFYWDYIAFAALLLVVILPAVSWLVTLIVSFGVQFRLETPRSVAVKGGEPGILWLYAVNRRYLPITAARLVFTLKNRFGGLPEREEILFPIGGMNTLRVEVCLRSAHCGRLEAHADWIRLYDFFCLLPVPKRIRLRTELTVLPETFPMEGEPRLSSVEDDDSGTYSLWKRGDDLSQVFDYHEYREGDRMKSINWKLSARLDRLMVKEGSLPLSRTLRIGVDLAGQASLAQMDLVLDAFCSLTEQLTGKGIPCEAVWEGEPGLLRLENAEDCGLAIAQLYQSLPCQRSWMLERMAEGTYTGFVYMTASLSVEKAGLLKQLRERAPVSVLYGAGADAADPAFLRELLGEEIPLTLLREGGAEEFLKLDLSELLRDV